MAHRGIYFDVRDKPYFLPKTREMGHPHYIQSYADREIWATRPVVQKLRKTLRLAIQAGRN
jgi:hypothetical protein